MPFATEIKGRLHWVYRTLLVGGRHKIHKFHRVALDPREEARWRASPNVTLLER
jgi:hypothetical protein